MKLAADGTLTETTAEVEDTTVETILGTLPIKEVLTAKFVPTDAARALTRDTDALTQLVVEQNVIRYSLTRATASKASTCAAAPQIPLGAADAHVKIDKVDAPQEKAANPNAIAISGQVVLPKKEQ